MKKILDSAYYPLYYANIHKQAEFTKTNGLVISPIIYRKERSWTKGHATLIFA